MDLNSGQRRLRRYSSLPLIVIFPATLARTAALRSFLLLLSTLDELPVVSMIPFAGVNVPPPVADTPTYP
jgi:hypothetical protein